MSPPEPSRPPLLVFGAHPDDIEFGCGGVVAIEAATRSVHFVVCTRGEAATSGTPERRAGEAQRGAEILGATLEWVVLGKDARLEARPEDALRLAAIIRQVKPGIVLAPSLVENQHPDHHRLGALARDAARLARYGGLENLAELPPHSIGALFYYAVTPEGEPSDRPPILVDLSTPAVIAAWTAAMEAHGTQAATRPYAELQLARARVWGLRAGVEYAQALYPNDPPVLPSLDAMGCAARRF